MTHSLRTSVTRCLQPSLYTNPPQYDPLRKTLKKKTLFNMDDFIIATKQTEDSIDFDRLCKAFCALIAYQTIPAVNYLEK